MSPRKVTGESSVHKKQIWVYRSSPPQLTTTSSHHHHHSTRAHASLIFGCGGSSSRVIQDGQSIDVDAPPDIIDVVDEGDDIIDEEGLIPHDLADSNDEDIVNLDIDDCVNMSADVARGYGGDGGGDDRPPPYQVPIGCGGCLGNRGKGTQKPNLGGRRAGRLHTRQETQDLGLKAITDKSGPVPIRFEVDDR
nr:hypothetical protein [Tanacetum cinerariifolium]